ncbi:hypothetical protein GGR95_000435 [Sulfitobacter undariae]|uniref:Uncharacterized protein n=1 Tax=Sulfitobacter undariae TaxID=1563671 RepID=A0A7W6E3L1_9RHOB|nr:hypothetical protein [Sulfitobacter undariae]MBB3992816.1 hypothetical protein [Sulfitobacter undariae]
MNWTRGGAVERNCCTAKGSLEISVGQKGKGEEATLNHDRRFTHHLHNKAAAGFSGVWF